MRAQIAWELLKRPNIRARIQRRLDQAERQENGCLLIGNARRHKVLYVAMLSNGGAAYEYYHRVAWMLHHGRCVPDVPVEFADDYDHRNVCVIHTCDNPGCINPTHLMLGSHKQNMSHKLGKHYESMRRAERSLNIRKAVEICRLYGKLSKQELADKYEVSIHCISDVVQGKTWADYTKSVRPEITRTEIVLGEIERCASLVCEGFDIKSIVTITGLSDSSVRRRLKAKDSS